MSAARRRALLALLTLVACTLARHRPALGAVTIMVDTAIDEDVDNAHCSLREAIIAANTNKNYHGCAGMGGGVNDKIVFNLGPGTPTINVSTTPLPPITEWVTIDGGVGRVELHGPGGTPVSGAHGLTVNHPGFGTIIRNLVINNFADDGIYIDADEVYVFGCFIGLDATGTKAMPNQGFGVQVFGGNGVRIGGATSGGPCMGDCNVISGSTNFKAGVLLDLNATGALVRGNFLGTDVTGTAGFIPNASGIIDKGTGDTIGGGNGTTPGGACTGDCNLITANSPYGINIDTAATGTLIQGNFIGTDVTGTQPFGIQAVGILIEGASVQVGGTIPEVRNIVSGNSIGGVAPSGPGAVIEGNYIGTDPAGAVAVAGSGNGIYMDKATATMIGGTAPGAGNLISGAASNSSGILILESSNTQVMGNLIGTAADGISPLPNQLDGVLIAEKSSNNTIGGTITGAGNVIAYNSSDGVDVNGQMPPVVGNTIRGNSIYLNNNLGIQLGDDGNTQLDPPTIDGVGPIHGTACAPCTVEIFSDSFDQGQVFQGSVFTNDGNWSLVVKVFGPNVTATNTDMNGNTSEFSEPFSLTTPTPTPTATTATMTATATALSTQTATSTPSRTSTTTSTASRSATAVDTPTATRTPTTSATATGTAFATATGTPVATGTATSPPTDTPTSVSGATPTATVTTSADPTATVTSAPCTGDCSGTHMVSISDLITGVNIALGSLPVSACPPFENDTGQVDIAQLVRAVSNALNGCPT